MATPTVIEMPVAGLRAGDKFYAGFKLVWQAMSDAVEQEDGGVVCEVQHRDGGLSARYWQDGDTVLTVERTA